MSPLPQPEHSYSPQLDVTLEKLDGFIEALDPDGIGSFVVRQVVDEEWLASLQAEVAEAVAWHDTHTEYDNARGKHVVQNHDTYALKIGLGDQDPLLRIPRLLRTGEKIRDLIRNLGAVHPVLGSWELNEISLHRYDDQELGLGFHRDNLRYLGVVAVLNIDGVSDLEVMEEGTGAIHAMRIYPGDLTLTRVSGIYDGGYDDEGKRINTCPDHAVTRLQTSTRTSLILRHNSRPEEPINGFEFHNWQPPA